MTTALHFAAVFVASFLVDICWVLWTRRSNEGRAIAAANSAVGIMLLGFIGVYSYTHNWVYVIPSAAGNWLGTWWMVRRDHSPKDEHTVSPAEWAAGWECYKGTRL
jgi:hypothetical protein